MHNKKKILIITLLIGILSLLISFSVVYKIYSVELNFSKNTLEYGEKVDFSKILKNKDITIVSNNYNPYKIGKQDVVFNVKQNKYINRSIIYTFNIKDTNNPIIKLKEEEIKLKYKSKFDAKSNVKSVTDIIDGKLEYEVKHSVNTSKPGKYSVEIIAKDKNDNKSTKKYKVIVLEEKKESKNTSTQNNSSSGISSSTSSASSSSSSSSGAPTSNVPSGKSVYISKPYARIPATLPPQGNFSDSEYAFIVEVLNTLNNSNEYSVPIQSLVLGGHEVIEGILEYIGNLIGVPVNWTALIPCAEDGKCYGDFKKNIYYRMELSPKNTKRDIDNKNKDISLATNALAKAGVYNGMSERDAINRINSWLCQHMTYKIVNTADTDIGFNQGVGQCVTYAGMFELMCRYAGIECYTISGTVNGEGHAWNKIIVGGKAYFFDTTWNDVLGTNNYSWLSESQMRKDHYW